MTQADDLRARMATLEVAGRISGAARATAIAVPQLDDKRYLCGPNRSRDWVRNLLTAGTCRLAPDEPEYRASLVDADEGAPVLDLYLGQLGRVSEEWPFEAAASLEEIAKNWDTMAVFRLETV